MSEKRSMVPAIEVGVEEEAEVAHLKEEEETSSAKEAAMISSQARLKTCQKRSKMKRPCFRKPSMD